MIHKTNNLETILSLKIVLLIDNEWILFDKLLD